MHNNVPLTLGPDALTARKALILLHGRGASPESMIPVGNFFAERGIHVVLPRAERGTWYPFPFIAPRNQNEPFVSAAISHVRSLMEETGAKVGFNNLAVAGFSQGACLALQSALEFNTPLAAVAGWSGGLIGEPGTAWDNSQTLAGMPVFLGCHVTDPHIPLVRVEESAAVFRHKKAVVTVEKYPGFGHQLMPGQVEWLLRAFQTQAPGQ